MAPVETPSAAVHDTTRTAEARTAGSTAETSTVPAVPASARAAEARAGESTAETPTAPAAPATAHVTYHTPLLSHPLVITPSPCKWGTVSAIYHTGDIRYHTPYTIPHPCDKFLNPKILSHGCGILCNLRYMILLTINYTTNTTLVRILFFSFFLFPHALIGVTRSPYFVARSFFVFSFFRGYFSRKLAHVSPR